MVLVSKSLRGYTGQQGEKGSYLSRKMSATVRKGLIGIDSARAIEWDRSRSVRLPVALSSQQFEGTYPENKSTKVYIAIQPVVGQHRDRVRWNPAVEGNRMV